MSDLPPSLDGILVLDNVIATRTAQSHVWAYMGVVGGAGVTSLAVQTAYELSASQEGKTVCLIDLDFERGACATYLDMNPSLVIAELNDTVGRMDADLAATFINSYKSQFSLISAEGEMGGNDNIDSRALLALLDCVCDMYDFVILDIPPMWRTWTQAVIGAADKFALVTEMRVPALHRTKKLSSFITGAMSLSEPPHIIINKFERRELNHSISLKDAQKLLQHADIATICTDEDTLRSAINCGMPASLSNPDARYIPSVRALIHNWLEIKTFQEKPAKSLFKLRPKHDRRLQRKRA